METLKFKTNITCSGCMKKTAPFLDAIAGEDNWEVALTVPEKVLTVVTEQQVTAREVMEAVAKAGYKAEPMH